MSRKQVEFGLPEFGHEELDPLEWTKLLPVDNADPVEFSYELLDGNNYPLPKPNVWKFSAIKDDKDKKGQYWSITGQRFEVDNEQPVEVKGWTKCELFVHNQTGKHVFNRESVSGRRQIMLLRVAAGVGSTAAIASFAWVIYRHHNAEE
jgi:hypothetical protein